MAITGKNLNEVARTFTDHLNSVLNRTITQKRLVQVNLPPHLIAISFRDQLDGSVAPLRTKYGDMDLYLSQRCEAVSTGAPNTYRLRTLAYAYTLTPSGNPATPTERGSRTREPCFRWEYVRSPEPDAMGTLPQWCRHHIQDDVSIVFINDRGEEQRVPLNDWHTPTGWVAIEEVIRFCIVDLGVRATPGWEQTLQDSTGTFAKELAVLTDR